ncbi:MAG: SDR family oxidoreductase [Planctomycetaceae bacterium]|nr:SDR family oxidoreductase [Planctomycetaceae bacterium]
MDLSGKNVLITGASRGIGRGCAVEVARAGGNVAINYRSGEDLAREVAQEVESLGGKALLLPADVSDQSAVEAMIDKVASTWGSLDGFVSNAVFSDRELMVKADMEGFRKTIDVSMWGAFYGVRASAQKMLAQGGGGAITVVSSPHATIPLPGAMAYNMAKAAIDQMARTAAIELAQDKIRVNVIHPGWIDTPGERKFFSESDLAAGAGNIPWKRLGTPEEIGRLIAMTLSPAADYMTGSTLLMDGGISLPWWAGLREK